MGAVALAGYIASIVGANLVFERFGVVNIGFGVMAPSAVLVAGAAFVFRDYLHEAWGTRACLVAVLIGAGLSAFVNPSLALASGAAFAFSEIADLLVFARLRQRGFVRAAVASNAVGVILDSIIFLALAFGSLTFLAGQLIGKAYATLAFLAWQAVVRRKVLVARPA